eukprot:241636-Prymnesium_polylepis.2
MARRIGAQFVGLSGGTKARKREHRRATDACSRRNVYGWLRIVGVHTCVDSPRSASLHSP